MVSPHKGHKIQFAKWDFGLLFFFLFIQERACAFTWEITLTHSLILNMDSMNSKERVGMKVLEFILTFQEDKRQNEFVPWYARSCYNQSHFADVRTKVQMVVICPRTFQKVAGGAEVWQVSASKSHVSPSPQITQGAILVSRSCVYTRC